MGRRSLISRLISFILVLAGTIAAVAVFSSMSHRPETQEQPPQAFSVGVEYQSVSAPPLEEPGISPIISAACFLALLALPLIGFCVYARSKRPAKKVKAKTGERIEPRGGYRSRRQI